MSRPVPMARPRTHPAGIAAILATLAAGFALAACGSDDTPPRVVAPEPQAAPPAERLPDQELDEDDAAVAPTPTALADGRRFDALVNAYAPVSERVNFLVAAETLRADAVAAGAGEQVEVERFGIVRVEILRMKLILEGARPKVEDVAVDSVDQQHVQDLMLAAIDVRLTALGEFTVALRALGDPEAPDSRVDQLVERWQGSWASSLRHAREATTAMQDARARLRLQPAPEESIR